MTSPENFHDGIFHAANRTNEAAGRSWHVPAANPRTGFYVWTGLILVVCSLPCALLWAVMS